LRSRRQMRQVLVDASGGEGWPQARYPRGMGQKIKEAVWGGGLFFYALRTKRPGVSGDGVATQLGTDSTVGF
jgi:hypothetical protein